MDQLAIIVTAAGLHVMLSRIMDEENKESLSKDEIRSYLSQAAIALSKEMENYKDKDKG
ncbi:hypothetical protein [Parabacteroides sp.]|uniref:hypothetical protein n=1 Tax=Parabacteroides sp. TaxID=1869337 RepID=UPI00307FF2C4